MILIIHALLQVRFAVNSLLSRDGLHSVTLVDTDPGQPEVGPPGTVSLASVTRPLLSPSFCAPPGSAFADTLSLLVVGTAPDGVLVVMCACVVSVYV